MENTSALTSISTTKAVTLIEICVYISIIALTAAFAIPNIQGFYYKHKLKATAKNIELGLKLARSYALTKRQPCVFKLENHAYQILIQDNLLYQSQLSKNLLIADKKLKFQTNGMTYDNTTFTIKPISPCIRLQISLYINRAGKIYGEMR